jgi:hypothetical protein
MEFLTDQEVFNKVVNHLLNQGKLATNGKGACAYRSEEGLKCAVGCLIPDKFYDKEIEGKLVSNIFKNFPWIMEKSGLSPASEPLLARLQTIHDIEYPSGRWRASLVTIAYTFGLYISDEFIVRSHNE